MLSVLFPLCMFRMPAHPAEAVALPQQTVSKEVRVVTPPSKWEDERFLLRHTLYTKADSALVVALLKDAPEQDEVLYYARRLIGVPYVGGTLEKADLEKLVVNLAQLDCTTLVETVWALVKTHREGSSRFADYCRNLMRLRYRNGRMNGYLSRLHYFTWWMHDNLDKGIMQEVRDDRHFTAKMVVNNYYMSRFAEKYPFLKGKQARIDSIAAMERRFNGADGTFLPATATALSRQQLACIQNGDLIAIVTRKKGLDYSHLGFAVWGKDGKLHLLNASSIHKKVVEEPKTLRQYLREHPTSIGIRLFRLK